MRGKDLNLRPSGYEPVAVYHELQPLLLKPQYNRHFYTAVDRELQSITAPVSQENRFDIATEIATGPQLRLQEYWALLQPRVQHSISLFALFASLMPRLAFTARH